MGADRAILLVDDEAILLLSLRQQLKAGLGTAYRYEIAYKASEALIVFDELAEEGVRVILVISDWLMPGMKGDEFLMIVRAKHPTVKTILISGQTDEDHLAKLKESGALDLFVCKPWDDTHLIAECRKLLNETA